MQRATTQRVRLLLHAARMSPAFYLLEGGVLVCARDFVPMTASTRMDVDFINAAILARLRFSFVPITSQERRVGIVKSVRLNFPDRLTNEPQDWDSAVIALLEEWIVREEARSNLACIENARCVSQRLSDRECDSLLTLMGRVFDARYVDVIDHEIAMVQGMRPSKAPPSGRYGLPAAHVRSQNIRETSVVRNTFMTISKQFSGRRVSNNIGT